MSELAKEYFEKHLDAMEERFDKKMNQKIDELARVVGDGFRDSDERLAELARITADGFHGVDERFNGVEGRLEGGAWPPKS